MAAISQLPPEGGLDDTPMVTDDTPMVTDDSPDPAQPRDEDETQDGGDALAHAPARLVSSVVTNYDSEIAEAAPQLVGPELRFLAIGDWGQSTSKGVASSMAQLCRKLHHDAVLALGDNFYPNGLSSLRDPRLAQYWGRKDRGTGKYEGVFLSHPELQIPWWAVLGNHDYQSDHMAQVHLTTDRHRNPDGLWRMPGRNYRTAFQLSDGTRVDIFALDTNGAQGHVRRMHAGQDQVVAYDIARLKEELRRTPPGGWRIVIAHHPMFTNGAKHSAIGNCLRTGKGDGYGLERVLAEHGVHLYLAGHEHAMQHFVGAGIHTFVLGAVSTTGYYGGFGHVYPECAWFDKPPKKGFGSVAIKPDKIEVTLYRGDTLEPSQLYRAEIYKDGGVAEARREPPRPASRPTSTTRPTPAPGPGRPVWVKRGSAGSAGAK
eukprot:Hpha_TRINITY_DN9744_c0_g1::TRINITY_DN9744_c0_g1_i1::g.10167::m.10167/K14379/ACP5; tartrate-resistant acid phosphatase type 5